MTAKRMAPREICDAMADTFELELNTSKAVYAGLPEDQLEEIRVVIVKAKAI